MPKKTTKKAANTEVADYSMQTEFSRTKLPTGEYSGIQPQDITGIPETKTVKYNLNPVHPVNPVQDPAPLDDEFAARDPDLDPQFIWRGKRRNDLNELEVKAPVIYQQEKIFPRMLIEEMKRRTAIRRNAADAQMWLGEGVEDFDPNAQPGFYNHEEGWKNRMILGDSLQVMASLAENESLRGKVQMIYFDPPYGIKFNSNWQPSTKSTNVKDGSRDDITREPEMVKAFRDTWHDGIHSYLGYLRDRLTVARDLLAESGSCFMQISDANVHKVRALMDEVFGEENFVNQIFFSKTTGAGSPGELITIPSTGDYLLWYAKNKPSYKFRKTLSPKDFGGNGGGEYRQVSLSNGELMPISEWISKYNIAPETIDEVLKTQDAKVYRVDNLTSQAGSDNARFPIFLKGQIYRIDKGSWKTNQLGIERLKKADRLIARPTSCGYKRFFEDFPAMTRTNLWTDTVIAGWGEGKIYVCQTARRIIERCLLMTTDPGDLVLDPTCGSGTTAYVAEQWGRRWITIDTSRVALALTRTRLMTAKYPYYLLADSEAGVKKEMEVTGKAIVRETYGRVSQGFVYERVPHITLKAIANDAEIDIIWEKYAAESERLRRIMAGAEGGK